MKETAPQCWLQISSGKGPIECALASRLVSLAILSEAKRHGLHAALLETESGDIEGTFRSALLHIEGRNLDNFIQSWRGSILWISKSPYRPHHKRKNWFVGVDVLTPLNDTQSEVFERDVTFETMRASGPGGQHVNTTDSAVRAIHIPTGLTTNAREERSQHRNKKLALARLSQALTAKVQATVAQRDNERWEMHQGLERGNPVRTFIGQDFKERK